MKKTTPFFLFWISYFTLFWSKALWVDKDGNLIAGHVNIWGDWAAHFTMGSSLAYNQLLPNHSPFLLGAPFSYPFMADFVSALLIRGGAPFFFSFIVPSFLFSTLLVFCLYFFYKTFFSSKKIAILAATIFLLNGGVGFWYFLQDVIASPTPLHYLTSPQHEYTRLDDHHLKWINVIDSMVIPQRAFNHGFPIALVVLALIYILLQEKPQIPTSKKYNYFISAAFLLGILPIIHTHSFLAVTCIGGYWVLTHFWLAKKKNILLWLIFGSIASITSALLIMNFFYTNVENHFFQLQLGWLAKEFKENWFVFWFKNWGLVPLLAIYGWFLQLKKSTSINQTIYKFQKFAPFFILFIAANIFLFQPFSWDNTKIIVWSSVGFSGLAAFALIQLWQTKKKVIATILLAITIATGSIDAYWQLLHKNHHYIMYTKLELQLAEWTKQNTPADSIWLTYNHHNNWLYNLAGRQALMTYPGWLWTHGYDYRGIEQDYLAMFTKPQENLKLFDKYHIKYVVLDNKTKKNYQTNPNQMPDQFRLIKAAPPYYIFENQQLSTN